MKKFVSILGLLIVSQISLASPQDDCLNMHVIDSEPLGFVKSSTVKSGVHWHYLKAIEQRSGLCFNLKLMPYARIWESMRVGLHDGGIVFRSEARSPLVEYVALIRFVETAVIPLAEFDIEGYNDLHELTVGKTRGSHLSERFDDNEAIRTVEMATYEQLAQMIHSKRINAVAGSLFPLRYQLNKFIARGDLNIGRPLVIGQKAQWLQLSKKSNHLDKIPQLTAAVESLKADGTFDRIMAEFYGDNWHALNQPPAVIMADG
ncbi:transporter substrate-binding domain-containing protein [Neiella marina]|uniref:Transporter substrate-binding domain-containing protein n=1 Tax=Neiella holothuriorum TaxID=2870530 RepID=A0ABS7EGX4_9GAMM|nr:transporter substrate-binding domain-containing protein [Neiella holothuriorum]MBW8191597.1 transporter substrate-binding domain-containing protein [Neiella holothuriorum]